MIDSAIITNWFTYHPPTQDQAAIYEAIRAHAREFAHVLNALVPDGADKSDALRKLCEVVMTANAGIATAPVDTAPTKTKVERRVASARKTATSPADTTRTNPRAQTSMWPQPDNGLPVVPKTTVVEEKRARRSGPPSITKLADDFLAGRR